MTKLSLEKINLTRDSKKTVGKSFRFHKIISTTLEKQARLEGLTQVHLLEKALVFYMNNGGVDARVR